MGKNIVCKRMNSKITSKKWLPMKRYCMALDLVDDPSLIAEYENWHKAENGWPEIKKSILDTNITKMKI